MHSGARVGFFLERKEDKGFQEFLSALENYYTQQQHQDVTWELKTAQIQGGSLGLVSWLHMYTYEEQLQT